MVKTPDFKQLAPDEAGKRPYALYRDCYAYYAQNYTHLNSSFIYTISSLMNLMTFDASENVHLINERLLMMAEKTADTFYSTEKTYSNATGIKDR